MNKRKTDKHKYTIIFEMTSDQYWKYWNQWIRNKNIEFNCVEYDGKDIRPI